MCLHTHFIWPWNLYVKFQHYSSLGGATTSGVTSTKDKYIEDICYTEDGSTGPVIITTHSLERRLCAYNPRGSEREWVVKGINSMGVTTDGRGHVFVCDSDKGAVQMYSVDGECLGVLVNQAESGLGKPVKIRWCEETGSAVIAHTRDNRWYISSVKLNYT